MGGSVTFAVLLVAELLFRFFVLGPKDFFVGEERNWNFFDVLMVASALAEVLASSLDVSFCRILRTLRIVRMIRVFRLFRQLSTLRMIVAMVGSSLFSVCWAIFALFMVAYMVAIFFMQAIADHVQTSNTDDEWRQHADSRYGSMHRCLLTLMASFSGGLDWLQAAENLETVGWAYVAVFLFYILFVLIGLLNIVTGVFVESAKNMAQLDSDLVIEQELHQSNSWTNQLKLILKGGNEMEHVLTE